jgi:hypothetical protein
MSKNSAGKVYFVLYLAVILELLIIIVERDEAEEHLRKREREAREIVQDMLAQMQIGRGDENLTSRITDEISLLSDEAIKISGIPYKKYRTYNIEVGVNDGNAAVTLGTERRDTLEHLRHLKQLANVQDVQYEVLYTPSNTDEVPEDEPQNPLWKHLAATSLQLDTAAMQSWQKPTYRAGDGMASVTQFAPSGIREPFAYNQALTDDFTRQNAGKSTKRMFTVQFQPTQAGWYKLRFFSKTNRIMGVGGDVSGAGEISDETKINIGSMQLTVKKLRKVQQLLFRELEGYAIPTAEQLAAAQNDADAKKFFAQVETVKAKIQTDKGDNPSLARDLMRKVDVYADITKLITPNKSEYFAQNHGAMEINVRVTKPPVAIVQPQIALPPEVNVFDKITPAFTFTAGPFYGDNFPQGEAVAPDGKVYKLKIERTGLQANAFKANAAGANKTEGKGEEVTFMARALEPLRAGAYSVRITHTSQGNTETDTTMLRVFPSRLKNALLVDGRMKNLFYGSTLNVSMIPDCDDRIPANQFRVYAALNTQPQTNFATGLTARLPLVSSAKSAALRVTWISPYTNEEVELLPSVKGDVKQREPDIDLSRCSLTKISGDAEELTIEVSGIVVQPATVDVGKRGAGDDIADVSLQQPSVEGVPMVLADSRLQELGTGDDGAKTFKAFFTLRGQPSKKPVELQGIVNFSISAMMRNPTSRVNSQPNSLAQSLNFTYTTPAKKGKGR